MRQPWAWAIIHGGKDVENRVRNLAGGYPGPVAIHAGLAFDRYVDDSDAAWEIRRAITSAEQGYPADDGQVWAAACIEEDDDRYATRGAIIGVVDLTGVHRTTGTPKPFCYEIGVPNGIRDSINANRGLCSPWAESRPSVWHLELANPQPLAEPIPFRGALGMRTLPADVEAEIHRVGFRDLPAPIFENTPKRVTHA